MKQTDKHSVIVYVEMRSAIDVLRPIWAWANVQVIGASGHESKGA
jgi:hypothetical protein